MKTAFIPGLFLLGLATAIYLLPAGILRDARLFVYGQIARLYAEKEPELLKNLDINNELQEKLWQKDAEIAGLRKNLRDIGMTREKFPQLNLVIARVVNIGTAGEPDTITIDAGSDDGIKTGDAVLAGEALIGVIANTGTNSALVLTLSSPACYIPARLGSRPEKDQTLEQELCAVRGKGKGKVQALFFSPDSQASPGWTVLTSGLDGIIPEGIIIGEITSYLSESSETGVFEADLSPKFSLYSIDYLAVTRKNANENERINNQ